MSDKIIVTIFTDPMMGLSYECEPMLRKLETHFGGQIKFRYIMSLLVRNVRDFMLPNELALEPQEGIHCYNARLAKIYESEESISGMPINMTDFHLFSIEQPSSLPLNLAYHAAKLTDAEHADLFLYNLRYATIVDCRPTTEINEILEVVGQTGIDSDTFLRHYKDGSAKSALERDLQFWSGVGVRSLPTYLIQYREKAVLLQSFDYHDFVAVIDELSDGDFKPHSVEASTNALRKLLYAHPLISPIEIQEALDLSSTDSVRELLQPLIESAEIEIRNVHHGWFVRLYQPGL